MELRTAVILCAGLGSRLWPLTLRRPKILVEVAGRSMLDRIFDSLVEAEITRAVLVTSPVDQFLRPYVADHAPAELEVSFTVQKEALGLGQATSVAREAVDDEPFLLYLGDELLEGGVADFAEAARASEDAAVVLLKEVDDPHRFGVAVVDEDNHIQRLVEKPKEPPSSFAVVGVYAFEPVIFDAIARTPQSARGEFEITDAIQLLADEGRGVLGIPLDRQWYDIGTYEALLESNRFIMEREVREAPPPVGERCMICGQARVAHDARVSDCKLVGPVIVGHGCRIQRAQVGPYVCVGDNTVIEDCAIEDSIIGQECQVRSLGKLHHSVLDSEAVVDGGGHQIEVSVTAGQRSVLRLGTIEG